MLSGAKVLITGTSRGLGLEMVTQLANRKSPPSLIFATCRNPVAAVKLQEVAKKFDFVKIIQLDVNALDTYPALSKEVYKHTDKLDILINSAGISSSEAYDLSTFTPEIMTQTLHTNLVAPIYLTKIFLPLLAKPEIVEGNPSLVVNISSNMGSISENTTRGGLYPYRCSKTALNAFTRSLSLDLKIQNISSVSIHPGWVATDMGGKAAELTPAQSISGVLTLIDEFQEEQNGNFYDYAGKVFPW
ncbi:uncharacterized protein LOC111707898 [Eurytemora carolleeae]|uniref:uncharacterized protein LOC111707898 n=1 Tax=Eurytemora carolleeae TaxID=1294199 RepID=UPI000C76B003|nr:uncharacterized protein LOC111707898 [Eurytemora carolleeae]|eukprot:XP_023336851.1 uncharacterized protein LOC111707898 [Eurytemora affinis]